MSLVLFCNSKYLVGANLGGLKRGPTWLFTLPFKPFVFLKSVDGHLSSLPRERGDDFCSPEWTPRKAIFHVLELKKRPVSGDFAYCSDVVVYIKSDCWASVMEHELHQVWLTRNSPIMLCLSLDLLSHLNDWQVRQTDSGLGFGQDV